LIAALASALLGLGFRAQRFTVPRGSPPRVVPKVPKGGPQGWSPRVVPRGGPQGWSPRVVPNGGPQSGTQGWWMGSPRLGWSPMVVPKGGTQGWWVVPKGGPQGWSPLVVPKGGPQGWSQGWSPIVVPKAGSQGWSPKGWSPRIPEKAVNHTGILIAAQALALLGLGFRAQRLTVPKGGPQRWSQWCSPRVERQPKDFSGARQARSRPVPPRPRPFFAGAMRAGPDWKTPRHDMAVWLPANIDDKNPCAVLA
jgi:hypothetical protein